MPVDPARLTSLPLFTGLDDAQRRAVADKFEERLADPGDRLSAEGGAGYFFFVIESGAATVTRDGQVLADFGPGDYFGEAAIFRTRRRTATVTATQPTTLLAMFGADFAVLTSEIPELEQRIAAALVQRHPRTGSS